MYYIPIEELLKKTNSLYKLVILASRRALELKESVLRLGEDGISSGKPSEVALKEILSGKLTYKIKPAKGK